MRVLSVVILFLSLPITLKAQFPLDILVLTIEQNDLWISRIEKETKSRQLELIKRRILLDTNVYVRQIYPDRIKIDSGKEKAARIEGYGKPLFVINEQYSAYINNNTKSKSIIQLTEYLRDDCIKSISIMKNTQAAALYGSRGTCGVILLATKNKRTFNQIKKINLSGN